MYGYRFPPNLTVQAWEAETALRHGPLTARGTWSRRVVGEGLHLDFSAVEFADFCALARALLLLDAAVGSHIPAIVTLPVGRLTVAERDRLRFMRPTDQAAEAAWRRITRRVRQRGGARAFMRHVGFQDALHAAHWPEGAVRVLDAGAEIMTRHLDDGVRLTGPSGEHGAGTSTRLLRALPFQWLDPPDGGGALQQSGPFLAATAGLRELGLSRSDVSALSHTVLAELLENVARHAAEASSAPPRPLIGAVLIDGSVYAARRHTIQEEFTELAESAEAAGSEILRLVVGDSSIGLADGLARRSGRNGEAILTAFERSASGADVDTAQTGTRGLWGVARAVRSYRGGVLVRTACTSTGMLYPRSGHEGTEISTNSLGRAPGTLFEVTVMTGPSVRPATGAWESSDLMAPGRILRWIPCGIDPAGNVTDEQGRGLARSIEALRDAGNVAGAVVTLPTRGSHQRLARAAIPTALRQGLAAASRAGPLLVVLVFPDIQARILDLSVEAVNVSAHGDGDAVDRHRPLLVLSADARPVWCGGGRPLRSVLDGLTEPGGVLALEDAERCWRQAGGEPAGLPGALQAHPELLRVDGTEVTLAFSPFDVLRPLVERSRRQLADTILHGGPGVRRGLFRTPTLTLVNRWIDVDELVAGTIDRGVAAFVLARRIEAALHEFAPTTVGTVVAQAAYAPEKLASRLSEDLSLGGRFLTMPGELELEGLPSDSVPRGTGVVLFADLISTENTIRRAVGTLAAANTEPILIACVVDTRRVKGDIRILNRRIPVVALAQSAVDADPGEQDSTSTIVEIDPISRQPAVPPLPEESLVSETDLLAVAGHPGALHLGHIERPPQVHFSAYPQVARMLRRPRGAEKITDALLEAVRRGLADIEWSGGSDPAEPLRVQLWHPGDTVDDAGQIAVALAERMNGSGFTVSAVIPVRRWAAGSSWILPSTHSEPVAPEPAIVVDWGALSGTSLWQLIRLAANSGATAVIAAVLLNQLTEQDAEALTVMRAVRAQPATPAWNAVDGGNAAPTGARTVSVAIRFGTTSSIAGMPPHDCGLCCTRSDYAVDPAQAPRRLARHAAWLRECLRPQTREEVFRHGPLDLFEVRVSSEDVIDYLRWRGLFRRAVRQTAARQEAIDRLAALQRGGVASEWTRDNLVRLLAAEQQWLKLPPLRFARARELLADICMKLVTRPTTAHTRLVAQALMILRSAAPERLVTDLPLLLRQVSDEDLLVDQLFLDCYLLLQRPPHYSPFDTGELADNLIQCRDFLDEAGTVRELRVADHLHVVNRLINLIENRPRWPSDDPRSAWQRLREDLCHPVRHHRLGAELARVRGVVAALAQEEITHQEAGATRTDWEACGHTLWQRALVNLPALREILAGDHVADRLGPAERERLLTLTDSGNTALGSVTDRLHDILTDPRRPHDPAWEAARQGLLADIAWWERMFLATHVPGSSAPALLVDLVLSAPVLLERQVRKQLAAARVPLLTPPKEDVDTWVFCPDRLLAEVLHQLLDNARVRHRIPDAPCEFDVEFVYTDPDRVTFVLRNSGTAPGQERGHGHRSLNEGLRPFGGEVHGESFTDDHWTYAAAVTLARWQGTR